MSSPEIELSLRPCNPLPSFDAPAGVPGREDDRALPLLCSPRKVVEVKGDDARPRLREGARCGGKATGDENARSFADHVSAVGVVDSVGEADVACEDCVFGIEREVEPLRKCPVPKLPAAREVGEVGLVARGVVAFE